MSIDLNWETLTGGPDGEALAERIRVFIHSKFQTVQLPRFIKSVNVHGFDFGTVAPELALKDMTDPLPDFYEQDLDEDEDGEDEDGGALTRPSTSGDTEERRGDGARGVRSDVGAHDFGRAAFLSSGPGILGGAGRKYFAPPGTQTPLAVAAGAHMGGSWGAHSRKDSMGDVAEGDEDNDGHDGLALDPARGLRPLGSDKSDVSTLGPTSRPSTSDANLAHLSGAEETATAHTEENGSPRREARVEDVQAVFRIRYAGDVRLKLTAEILLDYPMPSFVGIPLKLNITGLSFDGVGVLAYIRKRVHFCFLSPEDALAAVGDDDEDGARDECFDDADQKKRPARFAGLLQEIKVESEIGEREGGKASLKNVGKVERFVLEQVRRIFEEEFVYPSFWTFLV